LDGEHRLSLGCFFYGINPNGPETVSDNQVTITELTSTTVRGAFVGTVKAAGRPSISISDGEFYARIP
jgi:hypothetical protein